MLAGHRAKQKPLKCRNRYDKPDISQNTLTHHSKNNEMRVEINDRRLINAIIAAWEIESIIQEDS